MKTQTTVAAANSASNEEFDAFERRNIFSLEPAFEMKILSEMNKPSQLARQAEVQRSSAAAVEHYMRHGDLSVLAKLILKQDSPGRKIALDVAARALETAEKEHRLKDKTAQQLIAQLDRLLDKLANMHPPKRTCVTDSRAATIRALMKLATSGDTTVLSKHLMSYPVLEREELIHLTFRTAADFQKTGQTRFPDLAKRLDQALAPHRAEVTSATLLKKLAATRSPVEADIIEAIGRATWMAIATGKQALLRKVLALVRHADRLKYAALAVELLRISKSKSSGLFKSYSSSREAIDTLLASIDNEERQSYLRHRESTELDLDEWKDGRDPDRARALESEIERVERATAKAERAKVTKDRSTFSSTFSKSGGRLFVQGGAPSLGKRR